MKKILLIMSITLIILFLFFKSNLNAEIKEKNKYEDNYHSIKFENLNSKSLNELFKELDGTVIEIEVETSAFTKAYRFHTSMILNIERSLLKRVVKDLETLNKRELATNYKINGVKISRMDVLCNFEELEIIKSRAKTK